MIYILFEVKAVPKYGQWQRNKQACTDSIDCPFFMTEISYNFDLGKIIDKDLPKETNAEGKQAHKKTRAQKNF